MFAYTDQERAIFTYHDGAGVVHGDPLEIDRRLKFQLPNVHQVVEQINAADPENAPPEVVRQALSAQENLILAVRDAFRLADFDRQTGLGATDAHVLGVWRAFCEFLAQKKTPAGSSPTSAPPTAASPLPPIMQRSSA